MRLQSIFSQGVRLGAALMLISSIKLFADLTTLAKNDPYPIYTAIDPHEFLYTWETLFMKGIPYDNMFEDCYQRVSLALSPFGQNACGGTNMCGKRVPLGDLNGRWSMVGLLMGPLPEGRTLPPTLLTALNNLFPGINPGDLTDPNIIDPNQTFGFFSVPLKYQKRGLRWEFNLKLFNDFGFTFQGGVSDICQKVEGFDNLTCESCPIKIPDGTTDGRTLNNCGLSLINNTTANSCASAVSCCTRFCDETIPCCGRFFEAKGDGTGGTVDPLKAKYPKYTRENVNYFLMNNLRPIMKEIGYDICNFHKISVEDLRFDIFWRRATFINKGKPGWAEFLFIPFLRIGGSLALADEQDPNIAFSLPFGNNGHHSIGVNGGINLDFIQTVQIGAEFGVTHFFPRDICNYRVPNIMNGRQPAHQCKQALFPFSTDVRVCPGLNWHFGAKIAAHHFLDRLSFYFQYVLLHHEDDKITLKNPDPAFAPCILEEQSYFKVQLGNFGLNYDISPHLNLGFAVQLPFWQRNAYRSTTVLFSLWGTY